MPGGEPLGVAVLDPGEALEEFLHPQGALHSMASRFSSLSPPCPPLAPIALRGDGDLGARHVQEVLAQLVSGSLPQLEPPAMIPNFLAQPRSADEAAAARLLSEVPVFRAEKKYEEPCVVCRDDIKPGQLCRRLPCLHLFHKECIDQWIAVKAGGITKCRLAI